MRHGVWMAAALTALAGGTAVRADDPPQPLPPPTVTVVPLARQAEPTPAVDDHVQPAAFTTAAPGSPAALPPGVVAAVPDPPTPTVRVQVRVPADSPPGDDLKYVISVRNTSTADAHKVTVRFPMTDAIASVVTANPPPTEPKAPPGIAPVGNVQQAVKELSWAFGTLKGGDGRTIELVVKPKEGATEVRNFAYVRFEHGEAVTTRIHKPALKVSKVAPKATERDQPYTVRITVENTSKVPTANVRVTERVPAAAEVEAVTAGGQRGKDGQWEWPVGTLGPGQRKVIEYRITPRRVEETLTTTFVAADKSVLERAEARTAVLVPGIKVTLARVRRVGDGDGGYEPFEKLPPIVGPGETAYYEITVRNTGTLPAANVKVTAALPDDCRPTTKTDGGQLYRGQIVWSVAQMDPQAARSFRFGLRAGSSGKRIVAATAVDGRGTKAHDEQATVFQGAPSLAWETVPDPSVLSTGRQGTMTVRVRNSGSEPARNVKVEVDLPDAVELIQATPSGSPDKRTVRFPADVVPANGERTYTITYRAARKGMAYFALRLFADAVGEKPLETTKSVEVTGGG